MPSLSSLTILFAGSGAFGLPTLQVLAGSGAKISAIISQPDHPAGRGRKITPTPIAQFALAHGVPLIRTANIDSEPLPDADVLIVIAFGQKIGQETANRPHLGSVNLHASRLPAYRGAAPINWAILNGETETGNSIIRLAPKMDAGDVLDQSMLSIGELETAGELHDRLAIDGSELMLKTLQAMAQGKAVEQPQDDSAATLAPKLSRQATRIDWQRPAAEIGCQIRGLFPWPGCRVDMIDSGGKTLHRLTLVRARLAARTIAAGENVPTGGIDRARQPGFITETGGIMTGGGELEIVEIQPEGGRPMPLRAYRNGRPWPAGARLEPVTDVPRSSAQRP